MKANKIKLAINKDVFDKRLPVITHALPFFFGGTKANKYHHRIRSANNHQSAFNRQHTSVAFWCGGGGFIGNGKGRLYAQVPEGAVLCAHCEGKAIGASMDGARVINGREVMYSPKKIIMPYLTE